MKKSLVNKLGNSAITLGTIVFLGSGIGFAKDIEGINGPKIGQPEDNSEYKFMPPQKAKYLVTGQYGIAGICIGIFLKEYSSLNNRNEKNYN
mgnify:CR=1 FL=1